MSHQHSPSSEDKPGDLVGLYLLIAYSPRDTTKVFVLFYIYSYMCTGGVCGVVIVQVSVCGSQEVTFLSSTM